MAMKNTDFCRSVGVATMVVIATIALFPAAPAGACSCLAFEDALRATNPSAAFVGEVVDEQPIGSDGFAAAQVALLYDVEKVYHGDVPGQIVVRTSADSGAGCGLAFRGRTAVLAYMENGEGLTTSICSAVPVDRDDVTVEGLLEETFGPGTAPTPVDGVEFAGEDTDLPWGYLIGAGAFVLTLAGSSVLLFRRHG